MSESGPDKKGGKIRSLGEARRKKDEAATEKRAREQKSAIESSGLADYSQFDSPEKKLAKQIDSLAGRMLGALKNDPRVTARAVAQMQSQLKGENLNAAQFLANSSEDDWLNEPVKYLAALGLYLEPIDAVVEGIIAAGKSQSIPQKELAARRREKALTRTELLIELLRDYGRGTWGVGDAFRAQVLATAGEYFERRKLSR